MHKSKTVWITGFQNNYIFYKQQIFPNNTKKLSWKILAVYFNVELLGIKFFYEYVYQMSLNDLNYHTGL